MRHMSVRCVHSHPSSTFCKYGDRDLQLFWEDNRWGSIATCCAGLICCCWTLSQHANTEQRVAPSCQLRQSPYF